uniref:EAL domain-containing protein n=1 Tax=uncultured Rhizobium sp. TaxID=155567 RepID=UPI0026034302|nr:EAL domain-containing protein [uncultured Rhizobium sp.]
MDIRQQFDSAIFTFLRRARMPDELSTWTATGRHNRRVKTLILIGGAIVVAVSGFWSSFLAMLGDWMSLLVTLLALVTGLAIILLARASRLYAAGVVMAHGLLLSVIMVAICEVPPGGLPASNHLNLLPVIAATYLAFYREGIYLKVVLPVFGVIAFIGFSVGVIPILPHWGPDASAGLFAVWANHITGVVATCAVVVIMQTDLEARRALEGDIRRAIARGEFQLYYQPQVDNRGRMIGVEALLRWQHPTRGMVLLVSTRN